MAKLSYFPFFSFLFFQQKYLEKNVLRNDTWSLQRCIVLRVYLWASRFNTRNEKGTNEESQTIDYTAEFLTYNGVAIFMKRIAQLTFKGWMCFFPQSYVSFCFCLFYYFHCIHEFYGSFFYLIHSSLFTAILTIAIRYSFGPCF